MLILSRKPGQRIQIGEAITITVAGIRGDKVRLGIDAPKPINIARDEVAGAQRKPAAEPDRPGKLVS